MIKQDFIHTHIEGTDSYVLTEFEFIVKGLVDKNISTLKIKTAFERGLQLGTEETKMAEEISDNTILELLRIIRKSL